MEFTDYIAGRLSANGYTCKRETEYDLLVRTPEGQPAWVCNLAFEITPEQIRRCFDFPGHLLFVVNEKLIPDTITDRESTPMWLRVLHGLYMGRIYVWNGRVLYAMHFDWDTGDVNESSPIAPDDLLLVETGTWLRGWPGTYRLARFYDQAWWTDSAQAREEARQRAEQRARDQAEATRRAWESWSQGQSSGRQSYEQARDSYWQQQKERYGEWGAPPNNEPPKYNYGGSEQKQNRQERAYYAPPKQAAGSSRDFVAEFLKCGTLAAAKKLFRELAREYHPDMNPGKDTTETMQQINNAWDKVKEKMR